METKVDQAQALLAQSDAVRSDLVVEREELEMAKADVADILYTMSDVEINNSNRV